TGRLRANVTQTCVVSLDPVEASLDVPVEVEFWPAALIEELERSAEEEGNLGLLDWPEAVVDGRIDLGPVIYETLATALEPYPKREGVSFDWSQDPSEEAPSAKSGPFAALAALKRR
ncbi:MAG: YceD family protein, partial [Methyloceanibacter sp.]